MNVRDPARRHLLGYFEAILLLRTLRYIDTEQYKRNGFGDWENGRVMDPRFVSNYEARFSLLHDFSRETFMQRKLNVACATLCNIALALAYFG